MAGGNRRVKPAARHADIYNYPFATPREVQLSLNILQDHCESIGHQYKDIECSVVCRCPMVESKNEMTDLILKEKDNYKSIEVSSRRLMQLLARGRSSREK
jgi:hypothetical protein